MTTNHHDPLAPQLVDELRRQVRGRVTGAADGDWDAARQAWHLLADQRPAAVVHAAGVDDIAATVRFAREHGLSVTAQPVGHGATPALDGAILLRTTDLHDLSVDLTAGTARVAAGVRWRELNDALSGSGLTSLPGSSGDTTVVGYTLGGGLSWFGRKYGQAANHVVAIELVDPAGELVRVTRKSDPDLFWALRGGGGDFGIVTALEVELLPAEEIYGGRLLWPVEHARDILLAYSAMTRTAPDELTLWAWLLNLPDVPFVPEPLRGKWVVAVDSTFLGPAAEAEKLLAPLRAVATPMADGLDTIPLKLLGTIAQEPDEPVPGLLSTVLLTEFDEQVIDALLDVAAPGTPSPLFAYEIRHFGGALSRPGADDGAAGHVEEPYMLLFGGMVAVPELLPLITGAIAGVEHAMAPWVSGRRLPNFAPSDPVDQLYPADVVARLRSIKDERDPDGVFRSNHPVRGLAASQPNAVGLSASRHG